MALLTEHDILHKKFQTAKFRQEGYNQDEVDDFLDEVCDTIRHLNAENAQLKQELAAAHEQVERLQEAAAAQPEPQEVPQQAFVPQPEPVAPPAPAFSPETAEGAQSVAGMLALAQRVHDEYVANGKEEGERIISEAHHKSGQIVRDAEDQRERTLTKLEEERSVLERKIDELRTFESDYRGRLTSYLQSLLENVSSAGHDGSL